MTSGTFELGSPRILWQTNTYRSVYVGNDSLPAGCRTIDDPFNTKEYPIIKYEKHHGKDAFGIDAWAKISDEDFYKLVQELTISKFLKGENK